MFVSFISLNKLGEKNILRFVLSPLNYVIAALGRMVLAVFARKVFYSVNILNLDHKTTILQKKNHVLHSRGF